MTSVLLVLFSLALYCSGCAQKSPVPLSIPLGGIELQATPFYAQEAYQCGPAALAMLLGASGVEVAPGKLVSQVYLPKRRGSLQVELIGASRSYLRIPYVIKPDLQALVDELRAGRPVLILQNLGLRLLPVYHYSVVIGIQEDNRFILRSGTEKRVVTGGKVFASQWEKAGNWGMVVLKPGELPTNADPVRLVRAVRGFEKGGAKVEASSTYQAALLKWPQEPNLLFSLGNNYLHQGEYKKSENTYRALLSEYPDHLGAANNLAESMMRRGCPRIASIEIAKAAAFAEKKQSPLLPLILQTKNEIEAELANLFKGDAHHCYQP